MSVSAGNEKKNHFIFLKPWLWVLLTVFFAFLLYLSTMQLHINGSSNPFANDVGEIQNALPRWGTIHHSSYPLYSAAGSLFVTILAFLGVPPAAGASLFSAVFGAITIGLIALFSIEAGMAMIPAALGALTVAVSTSLWVDASLAEVHTVTLAFTAVSLIFALKFGRSGTRKDLLLLTFFITQAVAHQRSTILLVPSVLILIWPNLKQVWPNFLWVILITLLAPLTYLYLPLRAWMGADWIFGAPGTWDGFWTLFFDNRAGRVFEFENSLAGWWIRFHTTLKILAEDLPWPLLLLGFFSLAGMSLDKEKRRVGIALILFWLINFILTILIWEHIISDAQLAAKLPILIVTGIGIAYLLDEIRKRWPRAAVVASLLIILTAAYWGWQQRPFVISISGDRSIEPIIATVDRVKPFADGYQTIVITPWGRDYWGLKYAQAYRGQLKGLNLVDHNANHKEFLANGDHLLAPLATFLIFPIAWWEDSVNQELYLSTAAPGVIEMRLTPPYSQDNVPLNVNVDLQNGVRIRDTTLKKIAENTIQLTVYWERIGDISENYSVAVHLVAKDPPQGEQDILSQADNNNPVEGYYPTTKWEMGEVIRDDYLVNIPYSSNPLTIRLGMYYNEPDKGFINTPWYSIPLTQLSGQTS